MKVRPTMARRPDLVSTSRAPMRRGESISTPAPSAWNSRCTPAGLHQLVGGDLVGRGVVGLRHRLAEQRMRLVQPAEAVDAFQQFGGHAVHHAPDVAVHVGVQAAEIGDAGGGAHAARKP
jgi:hypothetical protein